MPAVPQKINQITRVDMDSDETRTQTDSVTFLKGWTGDVTQRPSGEHGFNRGVATPRDGALIQTDAITLPEGESYCIGSYESKELSELYVFCWNEFQNHFIYRVNGIDGTTQIVYRGKYLNFRLDPQYYIGEGRCVLKTVKFFNKATNRVELRKLLLFVDFDQPRMLSVEDSIQTSSFDYTQFPYYDPLVTGQSAIDDVLEKYINLAVPTPMDCIGVTPMKRFPEDAGLQNLMLFKGWQWRVKYVDVYGRESEHGVISDRYYTVIGGNCLTPGNSLPRCVRLKFGAGNPLVNKIQIEFRTCSGNSDLQPDSDWYLYDTIDKYDNSGNVQYWLRPIENPWQEKFDEMTANGDPQDEIDKAVAPLTKYNLADNTFEYTFCGDKQCGLIPVSETTRTDNLIPRNSSTLFPLNEGICLGNNKRGFEPLNIHELEKIHVEAIAPTATCDEFAMHRIVVYLLIHSPVNNITGSIIETQQRDTNPEELQEFCTADSPNYQFNVMWGINSQPQSRWGSYMQHGQVFPLDQEGWIVYLAGTPFYAITEQVLLNTTTFQECKLGVMPWNVGQVPYTGNCKDMEGTVFQKAEFFVPAGKYVVRVAGHRTKPTEDYQKTSTYVQGRRTFASIPNAAPGALLVSLSGHATNNDFVKEMYADISAGDYINHTDVFIIQDATEADTGLSDPPSIAEWYVYEDEVSQTPIALQPYLSEFKVTNDVLKYTGVFTDHNGFVYMLNELSGGPAIDRCDSPYPDFPFYYPTSLDPWAKIVCRFMTFSMGSKSYYLYQNLDRFPEANRRVISGKIELCGASGIGVGGVLVVPAHMATTVTNSEGEWTVVAHGRDQWTIPNVGSPLPRPQTDIFLISQAMCQYADCNDPCKFSFPDLTQDYEGCTGLPRVYDLGVMRLNVRGVNKSGPQNGGRYQYGVVLHDGNGRHGYVQTAEHLFQDIPSMIDTHLFAHSRVQFVIAPNIVLPAWVEYMTFVVSKNLRWDDFFMWSADEVAFIDAAGNANATTPQKVRIYYESMVEWIKQNNLRTNAIWDFIGAGENAESVIGDMVEFYINGDGTWFNESILYAITYDKDGKYFELEYDSRLKDLKSGAQFKVIRPKSCSFADIFWELCPTIPVVAGVPQVLTGVFAYRDSFFLSRQFPVPVYVDDPNNPGQLKKTVVVRNSVFFYEHHSPSDLWGDHCWTRGRVFFKNPFERELYMGMEFALSKPLINKSNFNGLSYFEPEDITRFDEQEWGSITVGLVEVNTVLVICQHNNFVVGFSDTNVRVDAVGNVYAGSQLGKFGTPQRKIGQSFGCQPRDINTIRKHSGLVVFLDRDRGDLVFHTYSQAVDVSVTGFKGWLTDKIIAQNENNKLPDRTHNHYFVSGIDPKTFEYYLTSFKMPRQDIFYEPGDGHFHVSFIEYLNSFNTTVVQANETAVVDLVSATMKGFAAFTPEYYGRLEGFHRGNNILMMRYAHGWSLHPGVAGTPYNHYFGQQTKKYIEFMINISPEKMKRFMYLEIYNSDHKLFSTRIVTEAGQRSIIPASWFDEFDNFYASAFLCDLDTPPDPNLPNITGLEALLEGEPLKGLWARVRLESADTDDPKYTELSAIVSYVIPSGQSAD